MKIKQIIKNCHGLSLIEMLITTLILSVVFIGVMTVFIKCMELSEVAKNTQLATWICRDRITEIENSSFDQIYATYNQSTFTSQDLDGLGVNYVDNSNPKLLRVSCVFCWQQSNGRVYGEDTNLNGQPEQNEDTNGNGFVDSPVTLSTAIFDR